MQNSALYKKSYDYKAHVLIYRAYSFLEIAAYFLPELLLCIVDL